MDSLRCYSDNWLYPMDLSVLFPAERPLEVDVGCGKGRFLLEHASAHPECSFLGIDRMLRRIRKIDRKARRRGLENIRLLRMDACYAVNYLLPENSVDVFYVFFPDPWPKKRHYANRLFDERFLNALDRTLKPGGLLHVATDHLPYFDEVHELLLRDSRFDELPEAYEPPPTETTDFELQFKEKPIGRCSVRRHP